MANLQTLEIPITGMDCNECTMHVQHAIEKLPGVQSVNVFLGSEKAIVRDCLKTRQKGKNRANLADGQIKPNLPD